MKWILFFGALIGSGICGREKCFGDQVFRINVRNGDEISKISQLVNSDNFKLSFWKSPSTFGHPVDILVPSVSLQPVRAFLKSQLLEYSVTIEDLQALLDNEEKERQHNEGQERSSNNFNYGAYHSLEAIYHEMDSIAQDFSGLVSRVKIGHSFENRSMYILKDRLWRKSRSLNPGSSCIGTDLNRNWNVSFAGKGASDDPCSEAYHGTHANSEVEVKSVVDFIQKHRNFKCFIDLHSYSQLLMYPYGYTFNKAPDTKELDEVARRAAKALASLSGTEYRVGPISTTIYPASGSSTDWAYDNGIKYAFAFELRDTRHYGFLLPANQIIPTAEETWLGMKTIMEHVRDHLY
ncbi:carboxypeptidase A4 isoform 2 [Camelus ferus]|nr:carboxypeptidase A4 isoform 2 [Camelus ferus]